jgi:hypothetical protein
MPLIVPGPFGILYTPPQSTYVEQDNEIDNLQTNQEVFVGVLCTAARPRSLRPHIIRTQLVSLRKLDILQSGYMTPGTHVMKPPR